MSDLEKSNSYKDSIGERISYSTSAALAHGFASRSYGFGIIF